MTAADEFREAAKVVRERATAAMEWPEERWMVDQSPDYGLVLGAFMPDDVVDGTASTGCVAFFAYPGDENQKAHGQALPTAAYMATMQPAVGLALAEVFDAVAKAARFGDDMMARLGYGELLTVARLILDGAP